MKTEPFVTIVGEQKLLSICSQKIDNNFETQSDIESFPPLTFFKVRSWKCAEDSATKMLVTTTCKVNRICEISNFIYFPLKNVDQQKLTNRS